MAPLIVAFAVSAGWCAAALRLGPRLGYLDQPGEDPLKPHTRVAVPLGGVGIFLAIHLATLIDGRLDLGLLGASGLVLTLGLVDDRRGLSPSSRLAVELAAAMILVWAGSFDLWTSVLGVVLVVAATNAVNLFDGLDGLAGSSAAISAAGLGAVAAWSGMGATLPVVLAAALCGFLLFNWHPARVFLGDAGAYVIGLVLVAEVLRLARGNVIRLVALAAVLGVFLIDLVVTMLRRWRMDAPLFAGDRSHVYDQLRERGWSVPRVAALTALVQLTIVGVVVAAVLKLEPFPAVVLVVAMLLASVSVLGTTGFLSPSESL